MDLKAQRWSPADCWQWHEALGWQCGFNYLPRNAVNFVAMWHPETFSTELIEQELRWAAACGFNALRTNIPFVLWETDRAGLLNRIEQFLAITDRLGFSVTLCPLDDCEFSGEPAHSGIQPPPVPGIHNSRAIGSPGRAVVMDATRHAAVADYVQGLMQAFGNDPRVSLWDLYNEPGNRMIFRDYGEEVYDEALEAQAHDLLQVVFEAAREVAPAQPLTVGAWHMPAPWEPTPVPYYQHPLDQAALSWSDVISFHAYRETSVVQAVIEQLTSYERPLICSEWMGRHVDSTLTDQLPILRKYHIHSYHWGLVQGLTQTHLPWPEVKRRRGVDEIWFHDVLHGDGSPYDADEIEVVRQCRGLRSH